MKGSGFIPFPSGLTPGVTDTKSHGVAEVVPVSTFALAGAVPRAGGEPSRQVPPRRGGQRERVSGP